MDKRLLINNVGFGLIVVLVWLLDFHYLNRLRFKIDRSTMNTYKQIRSNIREELKDNKFIDECKHFHYNSQDTIYLTFVNFKSIDPSVIEKYTQKYNELYAKAFPNIHKLKIYVKTISTKVTNLIGLVSNVKNEFMGIHTQKQNFYEVYIFNEFFDNQMIKDENRIFMKTSKSKLAEDAFISDVTKQSVFYFKNIGKLSKLASSPDQVFQTYSKLIQSCLSQQFIYYIDSLEYVNSNKNLVFFDKYLNEIKDEANQIETIIKSSDLYTMERILLKNDYFIYNTVYMYEDY